MKTRVLVFLIALFVESYGNKAVTILAPRTITGSVYKVFVDADGLRQDETLFVALGKNVKEIKSSNGQSKEVSIEVPLNQVEDTQTLTSLIVTKKKLKNICVTQQAKIFTATKRNFFNLIQTDKPVYKPGEEVRFRILTLDHDTKPFNYNEIKINVFDANGAVVSNFQGNRNSEFSFYENSFTLSNEPDLGKYKLSVEIDGINKKSFKTFAVQSFSPYTFQVYVESTPRIAFNDYDPFVDLKIYGKYPNEMFVSGSASIVGSLFFVDDPTKILKEEKRDFQINEGTKVVRFNLKKDFDIYFLQKPVTIQFNISLSDNYNQKSETLHKVDVLPKGTHEIRLIMPEFFRPGFSYKIIANVFKIDGELEGNSTKQVKLNVKYNFKNPRDSEGSISFDNFLTNGAAVFTLNPEKDAIGFKVNVEYGDAKVENNVALKSNLFEYLQVSYDPMSPKIGDRLNLRAECSGIMEQLKVVVLSHGSIVYSQNFPASKDKKNFDFKLMITKEMAPEATIIVYYVRENGGEIVFDEVKLKLGWHSNNWIDFTPTRESYSSKENVFFTLDTKFKSLVGLYGIDKSSKFFNARNEITEQEVLTKLTSLGRLKSKESKDLSLSSVVVLQPMKYSRHECEGREDTYINRQNDIEELPEWEDDDSAVDEEHALFQNIFPDVWLFEKFEFQENSEYNKNLPDLVANWALSGFSIHPNFGLSIAKPQILNVSRGFSVNVEVPSSVKVDEVFKIKVLVHNPFDTKFVDVTIQQGDLVILKQSKKSPECYDYQTIDENSKTLNAIAQSKTTTEFMVKASKSSNVLVKIDVVGPGVQDTVEKIIKVTFEGTTQFVSHPMLIDLRSSHEFSENIYLETPIYADINTVKVKASLSGNLLAPIIDNSENFMSIPEGSCEHKLNTLALSIYTLKYLKSQNMPNLSTIEMARNNLQKAYKNIKPFQAANGAFKVWSHNDTFEDIWVTAYAAQLMGDARELTDIIEDRFYYDSLYYFKSRFKDNELYKYGLKEQRVADKSTQIYLTAFIMIAVAKNKRNYEEYGFINNESADIFKKMRFSNDYEKAIVAYALALSYRTKEAEATLSSFEFEDLQKEPVKAHHVEIASYFILAATTLERFDEATMRAFNWLIKQRRPNGGFFSTHDTVLGLQALAAMQNYLGTQNPTVNFRFTPGGTENINNFLDSKYVELPININTLSASGSGLVYANVFYQFNTKTYLENEMAINLSQSKKSQNDLELTINVVSKKSTNMVIVEVEIPSGYEYAGGNDNNAKKIEVVDDKTKVIFYYDSSQNFTTECTIQAFKLYDVKEMKSYSIKAYDFYEPEEIMAIYHYGVIDDIPYDNYIAMIHEIKNSNAVVASCKGVIFGDQYVITSINCNVSNDINPLFVYDNRNDLYSVKRIFPLVRLMVFKIEKKLNAPTLEIPNTNLRNAKCVANKKEITFMQKEDCVKRITYETSQHYICVNERFDHSGDIGNPLICKLDGKSYLVGIDAGEINGVRVFNDVLSETKYLKD